MLLSIKYTGGILSRGILSWGDFVRGGFCPGGFCPDTGSSNFILPCFKCVCVKIIIDKNIEENKKKEINVFLRKSL